MILAIILRWFNEEKITRLPAVCKFSDDKKNNVNENYKLTWLRKAYNSE